MRKEFEKGSPENAVFRDFYILCEDFAIAEDTKEFHDAAYKRAEELLQKYKDTPAYELAMCMERIFDSFITRGIYNIRKEKLEKAEDL